MSFLEFQLPGLEGVHSDLREIPLLISVLYLPHPLYFLVTSLVTVINTPEGFPTLANFLMHWVALSGVWFFVRYGHQTRNRIRSQTIWWVIGIVLYYWGLMLPVFVACDGLLGLNPHLSAFELYGSLWKGTRFEMVISLVFTSFFANQYYNRQQLRQHMEVIAFRNLQLAQYAFINSHKLRAPVARLLGLANLMKKEDMAFTDPHLLGHFEKSCEELDTVVKKITEMLEEESPQTHLEASEEEDNLS
ncbi:MAG: hypothetical protein AAFQ98_19945 [Bacteroidota bacterium]